MQPIQRFLLLFDSIPSSFSIFLKEREKHARKDNLQLHSAKKFIAYCETLSNAKTSSFFIESMIHNANIELCPKIFLQAGIHDKEETNAENKCYA